MNKAIVTIFIALAAAGCSDPLRDVPRVSDIEGGAPTENQGQTPGMLARLFARSEDADTQGTEAETTGAEQPLLQAAQPMSEAAETPRRPGFFASIFGARPSDATGTEASQGDVAPGTALPFAQLGRTCNVPRAQLGRKIARHAGLTLWDSFPNSTAMRPHYITGFSDGCARIFTAALAMRGDPLIHEHERYRSRAAYTAADTAYERIKQQVCGVGRGTPCGRPIGRLNREIMMISTYDTFGSGAKAATIIIHNRSDVTISIRQR